MAEVHGVLAACQALGVSRATFYRAGKPQAPRAPRPTPKRALSAAERQEVLSVCHKEEFVDRAPATIHATLADRGIYLCSVRTFGALQDRHRPAFQNMATGSSTRG